MEEKFNDLADSLCAKIDSLEAKVASLQISPQFEDRHPCASSTQASFLPSVGSVPPSPAPAGATGDNIQDIQGEFQSIRDALSRVKLPAELKLNDYSRQGIRRNDQPLLNVISKCGRFNETFIKLLTTIDPGSKISQQTLDQLFVIAHAQCKYLQDEYASLIVSNQFDNNTSRLFRTLQRNTSGLNPASLETLRSAAAISAASREPSRDSHSNRGYSHFNRGGFGRGRRGYYRPTQDVFNRFANRPFPRSQGRGDNPRDDE